MTLLHDLTCPEPGFKRKVKISGGMCRDNYNLTGFKVDQHGTQSLAHGKTLSATYRSCSVALYPVPTLDVTSSRFSPPRHIPHIAQACPAFISCAHRFLVM